MSSGIAREVTGWLLNNILVDADDDVETIRVHMRHIRAKIDKISNGKKYIETIYGGGYRLLPEGAVEKK